jgi:hypothetical protein
VGVRIGRIVHVCSIGAARGATHAGTPGSAAVLS